MIKCVCLCFRAAEACGRGHGPDQPGHEAGWEKLDWSLQVLRPLRLPLWQVHQTPNLLISCVTVLFSLFMACYFYCVIIIIYFLGQILDGFSSSGIVFCFQLAPFPWQQQLVFMVCGVWGFHPLPNSQKKHYFSKWVFYCPGGSCVSVL